MKQLGTAYQVSFFPVPRTLSSCLVPIDVVPLADGVHNVQCVWEGYHGVQDKGLEVVIVTQALTLVDCKQKYLIPNTKYLAIWLRAKTMAK